VLVERTRRVVRFTPLGLRIADKAQRVLREAEELADMARAAGKPLSGELRMGRDPDDRAFSPAPACCRVCAATIRS
jgi:LysR family hydrogen peroxide-inducible transcriptional activator